MSKQQIHPDYDTNKIIEYLNLYFEKKFKIIEDSTQETFIKIGLFNIYDGYLNPNYGSSDKLRIEIFNNPELINISNSNKEINTNNKTDISLLYDNNSFISYIYDLTKFLYSDENKNIFLSFGTYKHSTSLYLTKFETYFRVVYINTGQGIDTKLNKHTIDKIDYYDLFNTIHVPNEYKLEFINFIKPIIYLKLNKIKTDENNIDNERKKYMDIMTKLFNDIIPKINIFVKPIKSSFNLSAPTFVPKGAIQPQFQPQFQQQSIKTRNIKFDINIKDDFSLDRFKEFIDQSEFKIDNMENLFNKLFNSFLNNDNIYNYINYLFNIPKFKNSERPTFTNFDSEWDNFINNKIKLESDTKKIKYIGLVDKNINFIVHNNNLYFELQKSGICIYKALIVTIFFHYKDNTKEIINFYDKIINYGYESIQNFFNDKVNMYEQLKYDNTNTSLLINKLNEDSLIDYNYNDILIDLMDIKLEKIETKGEDIYAIFKAINYSTLEIIISRLRNKEDRDNNKKELLELIVSEYSSIFSYPNNYYLGQQYYELITVSLIWEYYYNGNKWYELIKTRNLTMHNQYCMIYDLYEKYGLRIKLNQSEELWLIEIINYDNLLRKSDDKQHVLLENEILKKFINSNYTVFYANNKNNLFNYSITSYDSDTVHNIFSFISGNNVIENLSVTQKNIYTSREIFILYNEQYYIRKFIIDYLKENINTTIPMLIIPTLTLYENFVEFLLTNYIYFTENELYLLTKMLINNYTKIIDINIIVNRLHVSKILDLFNLISNDYIAVEDNNLKKSYNSLNITTNEPTYKMNLKFNKKIYNKIKLIINITNINKILKSFKENIHTIDSIESIEGIFITNSNYIYNPYIKINDINKQIEYKINDINYSSNFIYYNNSKHVFIKSFGKFNNIYITDNHVLILLLKKNFIEESSLMMKNDVFLSIGIINENINGKHFIKLNIDDIYIDNNKVILTNNIKLYPFLSSACKEFINFVKINENTNNVSYITISNKYIEESILQSSVVDNDTDIIKNNIYYEFKIKDNYLTFKMDGNNQNIYNKIYENELFRPLHTDYIKIKPLDFSKTQLYKSIQLGTLENIYKNMDKIIDITEDIYNEIIINFVSDELNLVEWTQLDYDIDCNISKRCDPVKKELIIIKINKLLNILKKFREYISLKLSYTPNNTEGLIFISENITILSLLMQINIIIKNMIRLKEIINKCDEFTCYEIKELNKMFDKYDKAKTIGIIEYVFEIIFGSTIKSFQWKKYEEIMTDYNNPKKPRRIHQLMMGRGKSSVLTPLLYLKLAVENNKIVYIVVPEHLKSATKKTLLEFEYYFKFKSLIITDTELKDMYLSNIENREKFKKSIFLIDEFDSIYNPLQSNYNIIKETSIVDDDLIDKIFNIVNNYNINNIKPIYNKENIYCIENEILGIINDSDGKNVKFGMSNQLKNDIYPRYVIPYSKKDSPNEKSKFSSNLITYVLTCIYFYNKKNNRYELEDKDIMFLFKSNKNLLYEFMKEFGILNPKGHTVYSIIEVMTNFYKLDTNKINNSKLFKKYYIFIFKTLFDISTKIENISFIDMICMDCEWQVGYSGTVNLNLDILFDKNLSEEIQKLQINCYDSKISEDKLEKEYVTLALRKSKFYKISDPENLINFMNEDKSIINPEKIKHDVLIDSTALFRDYTNTQVAEKLHKLTGKSVIYLLKDDREVIYENNKEKVYNSNNVYESGKVMYYYSQRHIIGSDFTQPNILNGIITIDDNSKYTNIAQAMFRMRKLNEGHTIDICYVGNNVNIKNYDDILKMIVDNETNFNNQVLPLLYVQYMKYYARKITNKYIESDLQPLYEVIETKKPIEVIINDKIKINIFDNKSIDDISDKLNILDKNILIDLYTKFNKLSIDQKLKVLFSISSDNTEQEREKERDKERTKDKSQEKILDNIDLKLKQNYFIYNYFQSFDKFKQLNLIFVTIKNNDNIIYIPKSFITLFRPVLQSDILLIQISEKEYIMENSININYYLYKFPIYNKIGVLINKNLFPEKGNLNINNLLNITFKCSDYKDIIFSFKNIFNFSDESKIMEVDKITFDSLLFIYNVLSKFIYIERNKKQIEIFDKIKSDILLILNTFSEMNYSLYLNDFYKNIDLDTNIETIGLINKINKSYNLYHIYPISELERSRSLIIPFKTISIDYLITDDIFKNKYLKYKQKYIKLKEKYNF